jgi:hypothetical protein
MNGPLMKWKNEVGESSAHVDACSNEQLISEGSMKACVHQFLLISIAQSPSERNPPKGWKDS